MIVAFVVLLVPLASLAAAAALTFNGFFSALRAFADSLIFTLSVLPAAIVKRFEPIARRFFAIFARQRQLAGAGAHGPGWAAQRDRRAALLVEPHALGAERDACKRGGGFPPGGGPPPGGGVTTGAGSVLNVASAPSTVPSGVTITTR